MVYIFWQNILSIHQSIFLSSLSNLHKVILVVEKSIDERRLKDGWDIPDFGRSEVIINPNLEKINAILELENAIHIFSGINSYNLMKRGFPLAIKKKVKIGIMAEPFNWIGIKGKLRFLKYFFYRIKYNHYISFILAIGNKGRWCFEKVGFHKSKIFDWGYFTKTVNNIIENQIKNKRPSLLYIGRLNKNKGILNLLNTLKAKEELFNKLLIIGDGPLAKKINKKINKNPKYEFIKNIPNPEIYNYIQKSDLTILPSIGKDGWGAVINESLMCGTPVLTSVYCGASVLLKNNRGKVFSVKKNNLEMVLFDYLKYLPYNHSEKKSIQKWATENISGIAAANYFDEIINHIFNKRKRPIAPWLK